MLDFLPNLYVDGRMESVVPQEPGSGSLHTIQGRPIGEAELTTIRELIEQHPTRPRRWLSEELARRWKWQTATGQIKNFAAYSLLLKLERRGWIRLPPPRRTSPRRRPIDTTPELFNTKITLAPR